MTPHVSAESLLEAAKRLAEAQTPEERREAAEAYVAAEDLHFKRLGVERHPPNPIARIVLPLILVTVLVISLGLNIGLSFSTHSTAEKISTVQEDNLIAQHEQCERTNDSRAANFQNLRNDVATLQTNLDLWRAFQAAAPASAEAETPPEVLAAFNRYLSTLEEGIMHKKEALHRSLAAIEDVALPNHSARVDCNAVVPLTDNQG